MKPLKLVIPCYNEAKSLPTLVARVVECATRRGLGPDSFHLILVDNGSSDGTWELVARLRERPGGDFLRPVRIEENRGYGHGIATGLRAAGLGILAWTHADEQCDPEDVFVAWERIGDRPAGVLVKGVRFGRAFGDRLFSFGFEVVTGVLLHQWIHEINAQPKVFDSSLLAHLDHPPEGFPFDLYVLLKAKERGWTIETIPVRFSPRRFGASRWSATARSKARTISIMLGFIIGYRPKS